MTCDECLASLASGSVPEIEQNGSAREHLATCVGCSRVIRLIAEAERDLGVAFNSITSSVPATRTAETAMVFASRRRTAKLLTAIFAVALAGLLWIAWTRVVVRGVQATAEIASLNQHTMTVKLQCLSADQAGELISPYVRSNGSAYYPAKPPLQVLTVRARPYELKKVREILVQFDNAGQSTCTPRR